MEILSVRAHGLPGQMRGRCRPSCPIALLSVILLLGSISSALAQAKSAGEYELKGAFLYNFTKFVEWPADAFPAPNAPIKICILDPDPFGPDFETALEDKKVNGRSLKVEHITRLEPIASCQVLFVSSYRVKEMPQIVRRLAGASVLTIGDTGGFANSGGIVNFIWDGNRVRFEINPASATSAKLKISAMLISLAKVVPGN